jgi:hypothetical protein
MDTRAERALLDTFIPPREPTRRELRHMRVALALLTSLIAVVVAGGLVSFAAYRNAGEAANTSTAVAQINELRACQAAARASVDDSQIAYDQASANYDAANKEVVLLVLQVIQAGPDAERQAAFAELAPSIAVEIEAAFAAREKALRSRLDALGEYQRLIGESAADQGKFLAACRQGFN